MTAEEYYQQGNAWRKQGDFKRALDCYMEAIALDHELLLQRLLQSITTDMWTAGALFTPMVKIISKKLEYE